MNITHTIILQWLKNATEILVENKDYLTELDGAIGDADHGLNMSRGFSKVKEKLEIIETEDIGEIFKNTAMTLISSVGGASGPLFGSFFLKASMVSKGKSELTTGEFTTVIEAGVKGIQERGRAVVGEKTMIDVWIPVVEALKKAGDASIDEIIKSIIEVAEKAKDKTKDLLAKKGRASYLGERSIGHLDPGATSTYFILKSLEKTLIS